MTACPLALAAGTGTMQGHNGQGTSGQVQVSPQENQNGNTGNQAGSGSMQMQAPPSGGRNSNTQDQNGNTNNQMQPPSGGIARNESGRMHMQGDDSLRGSGNLTPGEPPKGFSGNMTQPGGHGGMAGNMTPRQIPSSFDATMTRTGGPQGMQGNLTPPDMIGNSSLHRGPGGMGPGNSTPLENLPGDGGDSAGAMAPPDNQARDTQSGQQSAGKQTQEDMIADLITRLQSLLSQKK
ncbi:MAG: hypothetical protein GYA23_05585 [Methanomicrobiales archaeon]|nr:hypothetical protein [Methanomicrobiales archaeon]